MEKSAGAIIFFKEDKKIYYLVLLYPSGSSDPIKEYWGFPKGGIEKKETAYMAAKREIEEETGLKDIEFISGFKEEEEYFFSRKGEKVFKKVIFFLAEAKTKEIELSSEHLDFKWLDFENALNKLSFKNAKKILIKANSFISN